MKLLLDMNLSPLWVRFLEESGFEAWARERGFVVITHDLGFSAILASTDADGPSVLQVRTQDVLPDSAGTRVVRVLREHARALDQGAIVSIDELASRVRVLPIRKD